MKVTVILVVVGPLGTVLREQEKKTGRTGCQKKKKRKKNRNQPDYSI